MKAIREAYEKLFDKNSAEKEDWEVAKIVLGGFDVPALGEGLAKEVIFDIVNHIHFPTEEMTREIVGRAEALATELFSELAHTNEPHMAELEYLEYKTKK